MVSVVFEPPFYIMHHQTPMEILRSGHETGEETSQQVATLMAVIGVDAVMLIDELTLTAEQKESADAILEELGKHLIPQRAVRVERAEFNTICRMKRKVKKCPDDRWYGNYEMRKELLKAGDTTVAEMVKKSSDGRIV